MIRGIALLFALLLFGGAALNTVARSDCYSYATTEPITPAGETRTPPHLVPPRGGASREPTPTPSPERSLRPATARFCAEVKPNLPLAGIFSVFGLAMIWFAVRVK